MKTSCLTPSISANMFPTHQKNPPKILNNKSAPCQSLTHQINVTERTNSQPSPCLSESVELTAACNFCRGTGITSLFCLLIKVKQIQKFPSQVGQAQKWGSCPCPFSFSSSNRCQPNKGPSPLLPIGTRLTAPASSTTDNPASWGEEQLFITHIDDDYGRNNNLAWGRIQLLLWLQKRPSLCNITVFCG